MRKRLVLILLVAGAMGLVAAFLVHRVLSDVVATASGESERVVVAAVNMNLADTVTSSNVKLARWPKASVPTGALKSVEEAEGRVVRSTIYAGEPLIDAKLAPQLSGKGGIMPMLVQEGSRAVTIKVDDATRESGFVLPNSKVDVLVSMAKVKGSEERIAKVILQDVPVLASGQTVELRDNKPVTVPTVTLSLTPEQTERLAVAQAEGRLMLALRNLRDNVIVKTPGATPTALLTDRAVAAPEAPAPVKAAAKPRVAPVASRPAAPPVIETVTVSVIRGGQVSDKVFVRGQGQPWAEKVAKP